MSSGVLEADLPDLKLNNITQFLYIMARWRVRQMDRLRINGRR